LNKIVVITGASSGAIASIIATHGNIHVVVHNAGHMVFGPAEAFTPEQLGELYDINVLSTQRVNRAILPQLRKQRNGLLVWVSSSSSAGGTPPYLAPYFAAKAGMDADAAAVGDAIAKIVDMPFGKRPFRVHIDPTQDGAKVAFTVIDRMRTDMLHRVGLDKLLIPVKVNSERRVEKAGSTAPNSLRASNDPMSQR
jgi:hypothetical protein